MELKHESITLSSLVGRALNPTCSILICFSREGDGVLAPGFLRSLYRRVLSHVKVPQVLHFEASVTSYVYQSYRQTLGSFIGGKQPKLANHKGYTT